MLVKDVANIEHSWRFSSQDDISSTVPQKGYVSWCILSSYQVGPKKGNCEYIKTHKTVCNNYEFCYVFTKSGQHDVFERLDTRTQSIYIVVKIEPLINECYLHNCWIAVSPRHTHEYNSSIIIYNATTDGEEIRRVCIRTATTNYPIRLLFSNKAYSLESYTRTINVHESGLLNICTHAYGTMESFQTCCNLTESRRPIFWKSIWYYIFVEHCIVIVWYFTWFV